VGDSDPIGTLEAIPPADMPPVVHNLTVTGSVCWRCDAMIRNGAQYNGVKGPVLATGMRLQGNTMLQCRYNTVELVSRSDQHLSVFVTIEHFCCRLQIVVQWCGRIVMPALRMRIALFSYSIILSPRMTAPC